MIDRTFAFVDRPCCPSCDTANGRVEFDSRFDEGCVGDFVRRYYKVDPARFGEARFTLVRCSRCTLLYQRMVGDAALLGELYGRWINDDNRPESDPQYRARVAKPLESRDGHEIFAAAAFLGKRPDEMATLDYGMGWGLWARIAEQLGCRSFGSELSPERVDFARAYRVLPIADAEIGGTQFDFINTEQVMEHVTALRPPLDRLAAALVPGGILKISVPSGERVEALLAALRAGAGLSDKEWVPVQPLEHVNCFTERALAAVADELGMAIVRPTMFQRFAFVGRRDAIGLARPANAAKELARPFVQYRNPRNLYMWLQRPRAPRVSGEAPR